MSGHEYGYRASWGHHRGGFPLLPLLFIGFLLLGGWKLIFPLMLIGFFLFLMKSGGRHHGGRGWHGHHMGRDWGKHWGKHWGKEWGKELGKQHWGRHWGWDDDDDKPKRKNDDEDEKPKNDGKTLYI